MSSMLELEAIAVRSRITRARIELLLSQPFFGPLAMRLEPVARQQDAPFSTDGRRLFFNPKLVAAWSNSRLKAAIAHEVFHCALGHPWRIGERDHGVWNEACDHVTNLRLKAEGFDVGENWLADEQYAGMSAEIVYSKMRAAAPPPPPPQPQQQDDDGDDDEQEQGDPGDDGDDGDEPDDSRTSGDPGDDGDGAQQDDDGEPGKEQRPGDVEQPQPEGDEATAAEAADELEAEWRQAVEQAAALSQGENAGAVAEAIAEARRARIDWRSELRRKLSEITRDDYSWRAPNPRYVAHGIYLPALRDESLGEIVIVRDTSGSIGNAEIATFNAEIAAIVGEVKPARTIVIDCDARVAQTWEIEPGDDMPDLSQAYGRGGTSFVPPFQWLEARGISPKVLVYLTDLEGDFPEPPPYDVMWCCTTRAVAPWGETLPLLG